MMIEDRVTGSIKENKEQKEADQCLGTLAIMLDVWTLMAASYNNQSPSRHVRDQART